MAQTHDLGISSQVIKPLFYKKLKRKTSFLEMKLVLIFFPVQPLPEDYDLDDDDDYDDFPHSSDLNNNLHCKFLLYLASNFNTGCRGGCYISCGIG